MLAWIKGLFKFLKFMSSSEDNVGSRESEVGRIQFVFQQQLFSPHTLTACHKQKF